ncbi:MAG: hypothetical protein KAT34_18815 [Candidatus Aminicenantes bacterium]|nr:hypothetical protein [Candidatus Aminicenantes bacterium]
MKDYSEILKYVRKNVDSWKFEKCIKPILNIYPEECYRIITKKTDEFLENHKARRYYQEAARWLELLLKIESAEVRKRTVTYFENMKIRYKTRRALMDELKKAGIIT